MTLTFLNRWNRWQRILAYLVLAVALYLLLVWQALPRLLQWQLTEQLTERLGRDVSITAIHINPFELDISVEGFHIKGREGQQDFAGFERFYLDYEFWSLLQGVIEVKTLQLTDPYLMVERDAQAHFSFDDILARLAAQQEASSAIPEESTEPTPIPNVALGRLTIEGGRLHFLDQSHGSDALLDLDSLLVEFEQLTTQTPTPEQNGYRMQARLASGGDLALSGRLDLPAQRLEGLLNISELDMAKLEPFVAPYIDFRLQQAIVGLKTRYGIKSEQEAWVVTTHAGKLSLEQLHLTSDSESRLIAPDLDIQLEQAELGLGTELLVQSGEGGTFTAKEGSFALNQLKIKAKGKSEPLVNLGGFNLEGIALNTHTRHLDVASINLSDTQIRAELTPEGELDLVHLLLPPMPDPGPDPESESQAAKTPLWSWQLGQIQLHQVDLLLTESNSGQPIEHPLQLRALELKEITSDFANPVEMELNAKLYANTSLQVEGPVELNLTEDKTEVKTQLAVDLKDLDLAFYQPFIEPYVTLELQQGLLGISGDVDVAISDEMQVQTDLAISLKQLVTQADKKDLLTWASLELPSVRLDLAEQRVDLGKVILDQPFARLLVDENGSTNMSALVKSTEASSDEVMPQQGGAKPSESPPWKIYLGGFTIHEGEADFTDNSLTPNFATTLHSLQGEIGAFSTEQSDPADVSIQGLVDQYAPVTIDGSIQPLLEKPFLDLALDFKNLELTTLNPYSGTYAGYAIDKGQLSLALDYELAENQLKGSNQVIVDQLQLGSKTDSEEATSLPIALAVALLKDQNGVIDLGLEVSGRVDDPEFGIGALIGKALTNLIKKIVTSPFSLLGSLVGDDEQLNEVTFEAGQWTLSQSNTMQLDKLAQALNSRPVLNLEVLGYVDAAVDSPVLVQQMLLAQANTVSSQPLSQFDWSTIEASTAHQEVLDRLALQLPRTWRQTERKAVATALQSEQLAPEADLDALVQAKLRPLFYQTLLEQTQAGDEELSTLAQKRAKAIKSYLIEQGKIDASRIFVLQSHLDKDAGSLTSQLTLAAD